MTRFDSIKRFYLNNLPGARLEGSLLRAPCPICARDEGRPGGTLGVNLNPDSFFVGYFRCTSRCVSGGFPLYFAKLTGIDPKTAPGFDPEREPYVRELIYPTRNLDAEVLKFAGLSGADQESYFKAFGVSPPLLKEMKIGYNGRYLVYPYILENGISYAARCVLPGRGQDNFWHGNETFFTREFRIYNVEEIERCEGGALFVTDGEDNLLALKEIGYPGIAVPSPADLDSLTPEFLAGVRDILLLLTNSPEAHLTARLLATRLGHKVRILEWDHHLKRGYTPCRLAADKGVDFARSVSDMIRESRAFSPFRLPESEHRLIADFLQMDKGKKILGFESGFEKMDQALDGIRGISIMGGLPKAGKSCFFMQISTEMALRRTPVIYYDFENGRRKIYLRTLARWSSLSERAIRTEDLTAEGGDRLREAFQNFKLLLRYFRVVTDRKLNPEIMRRQIDFLKHETGEDAVLVVLDSLHKLPFKDLTQRRTGIDSWLRQMEAIRDEQNVSFLVVSELSRGKEGGYDETPDLGSFKGSGDIEYSADNAMVLIPNWDPLGPITAEQRRSTLWMVASRENSPGKIADYRLEYPYWRFIEI